MLKLKSCPKCKAGDITFDRDQYGWYEYCIQCGHIRDLARIDKFIDEPAYGEDKDAKKVRPSAKGK